MYKIVLLFAIAFLLFIAHIIYLADTAQKSIFFEIVKATPYGDKIGHIFLFGTLTLSVNIGFKFFKFEFFRFKFYVGTLIIPFIVLAEEISQYYFPNRTLDGFDLLADAIGISFATIATFHIQKRINRVARGL